MNETPTSNQTQTPRSGKATETESIAGVEKEATATEARLARQSTTSEKAERI